MMKTTNIIRLCLPILKISSRRQVHAANSEVHLAKLSFTSHGQKNNNSSPIIILHGMLGSKQNWNSVGKLLNEKLGRQIVCVDVRNHGQSEHKPGMTYEQMSDDLKPFLISEKLSPASLIGHSMGGRIAMYFSLKNQSMVEKLIVVDISPIANSPSLEHMKGYFKALREVTIPRGSSIVNARKVLDQQLAEKIKDTADRQFILMNLLVKDDGSIGWKANLDALERHFDSDIVRFPHIRENESFRKPTLFIAGRRSDYMKPADEEKIRKIFPMAKFNYVENAGHWVHADQPEIFMDLVASFLK